MCSPLCIVVGTILAFAALPQMYASPSYNYATGENLVVQSGPQAFNGISDLVTLNMASSPLDSSTVNPTKPSGPDRHFMMTAVQTTEDFNSAFSISAEVQGGYGGFSSSASSKYVQSKSLTSTTSMYFAFYEKHLGSSFLNDLVSLTEEAKNLLLTDPYSFAKLYGKYYIYGVTHGCQASSTVTITSKSAYDKTAVDAAAKASYVGMFSASSDFTQEMESQSGFSSMETDVFSYGGDVPSVVTNITQVRTLIFEPLDTGGKCSVDNAVITRAMIRSWLSLQAVSQLVGQNATILEALSQNVTIPIGELSRMNDVILDTANLLNYAVKCSHHVFSCTTKQWNEPVNKRQTYYTNATIALTCFQNKVDSITEATLAADPNAVLNLQLELEYIYQNYLKPAETVTSFAFMFTISVLTSYNDYKDPPPHGTKDSHGTFVIDPNHEDTDESIPWNTEPRLDNGHDNCRHFHGHFHARYQSDSLYVYQDWDRVCGGSHSTPEKKYQPGGDTSGSADYEDIVRTVYSFGVTYNYGNASVYEPEKPIEGYCTADSDVNKTLPDQGVNLSGRQPDTVRAACREHMHPLPTDNMQRA